MLRGLPYLQRDRLGGMVGGRVYGRGMRTDQGTRISAAAARRIVLAAQGFTDPRPAGKVDARHIRRVMARIGFLQLDALTVLCRVHYATLYGRLGPYPRELLDRLAWQARPRTLFEYWGNAATLLPLSLHPLLRWRMARTADELWSRGGRVGALPAGFLSDVLAEVAARGPVSAGELTPNSQRRRGGMFNWSDTKVALEWLFYTGRLTIAARPSFTRLYDLTERVLPAEVLAMPTPAKDDAQRELLRLAARSLGVFTEPDLRHYWNLRPNECRPLIADLVESGELVPARVEGWRTPSYIWHRARIPRHVHLHTLLSPFDQLIGGRSRGMRVFGFDFHIEWYVPKKKRVYGYFVLPFLLGDRPVARVDLKSDRKESALVVHAAHAEAGVDHREVSGQLAIELRRMADWLELERIAVTPRGDLGPSLARALP
jgi:uncharacterized protein